MDRREFQVATLMTNKSHEDIMVLAAIEGSSVGRILRNAIMDVIERRRHEIEKYRRLKSAA
jgi:hypothetical protein